MISAENGRASVRSSGEPTDLIINIIYDFRTCLHRRFGKKKIVHSPKIILDVQYLFMFLFASDVQRTNQRCCKLQPTAVKEQDNKFA